MNTENLKEKTMRGLITQFTFTLGVKLFSFIQIIIFARIFAPNDFGIFATASLVVSFVMLFTEMGINQQIIRENKNPEKVMDTAFSLNIIVGFLFFTLIFFIAPFAADFFNNQDLVLYIRFLSYSAFGAALGLPGIMWVKDMRFGMAKLPIFVSIISNMAIAYISVVYFNLGTWGLFLGGFAGFLGNIIITWVFAPYKPKPRFDINVSKKLFSFGWPLFFSSILGYIVWQGDDLAVRYFWGDEELGFYTFAFYLPMFMLKFVDMINIVLFPAYSRIQDSKEKLEYAFNISNKYIAIIFAPLGMSLFAFSPQIIHYIFTDKWISAVDLLRLFALGFVIRATTGSTWGKIALVKGKTQYIMFTNFINAFFMCTIGIYLIFLYGSLGGAYYNLIIQVLVIPFLSCYFIKKEIGNLKYLRNIPIPLFVSIILALIIYSNESYINGNIYLFIIALVFYYVLYFLIIFILDKNLIEEIKSLFSQYNHH